MYLFWLMWLSFYLEFYALSIRTLRVLHIRDRRLSPLRRQRRKWMNPTRRSVILVVDPYKHSERGAELGLCQVDFDPTVTIWYLLSRIARGDRARLGSLPTVPGRWVTCYDHNDVFLGRIKLSLTLVDLESRLWCRAVLVFFGPSGLLCRLTDQSSLDPGSALVADAP